MPEIQPINVDRNYNAYSDYISYLQRALANSMPVPMEYISHEQQMDAWRIMAMGSAQRDQIYVRKGRAMGKSDAILSTIRGRDSNLIVIDELSYMYPSQFRTIPRVRRHKPRIEDLEQLVLREVERRQDYYVTGTEPILP
jgi:hypothetical protein